MNSYLSPRVLAQKKKHFIQVRWARHCWRSKDELICDLLQWTPTNGHASVGWLAKSSIHQLSVDIWRQFDLNFFFVTQVWLPKKETKIQEESVPWIINKLPHDVHGPFLPASLTSMTEWKDDKTIKSYHLKYIFVSPTHSWVWVEFDGSGSFNARQVRLVLSFVYVSGYRAWVFFMF